MYFWNSSRIVEFSGFSKSRRSFKLSLISSSKVTKNCTNRGIRRDSLRTYKPSTNRYAETATALLEMLLAFSPKWLSMSLRTSLIRTRFSSLLSRLYFSLRKSSRSSYRALTKSPVSLRANEFIQICERVNCLENLFSDRFVCLRKGASFPISL